MNIPRNVVLSFLLALPLFCIAASPVDINTADVETLMSVKGIGEKRAAAIIDYREQHGLFNSVDDLVDVKGISETLIEKSRSSLKVSGKKK